jgi:hypothetical protein
MAEPTVLGDDLAGRDRVLDAWGPHDREDRHELLVHERMRGQLGQVGGQRGEQDLRVAVVGQPGHRREVRARLPESGDLHAAVLRERKPAHGVDGLGFQHVGAHAPQLGEDVVVDRLVDHQRLLGGADHRCVEGLGDQHVHDGHPHVGAAVQVDRRVAGTDPDAGLAGLVGGLDRLGSARRPDEVDPGVMEQVLRDVERRVGDHLQRIRGQPGLGAGLLEDLHRALGAASRARRRPEDHRVACLGRHDRLEERGGGGVGDRQQRQDDADRLGDLLDAPRRVLRDDTDRALVLEVVVEELGRDVVLDHLVLEDAEAGLLHRQLGQLDRVLETGHDHGPHDAVDGLLVEPAQRAGRRPRAFDIAVQPRGAFGFDGGTVGERGHQE